MEQDPHTLQDQKYPGADYFFQAIEMANEEANSELDLESDFFSWKVVKRRQKPQRRYTVSHAAPPAPPSTPTPLSKEHGPLELSMLSSPTDTGFTINGSSANGHIHGNGAENDECRLGSLLYILDYAPKYKKKLKEQQRTDAELSELFKVITITGGGNGTGRGKASAGGSNGTSGEPLSKSSIEHGVSHTSRRIRRSELNTGLFKIHRNRDDAARVLHDEDSLSAPEFEAAAEENATAARRWRRRRYFRYKQHDEKRKRMAKLSKKFDSTMSFQLEQ